MAFGLKVIFQRDDKYEGVRRINLTCCGWSTSSGP